MLAFGVVPALLMIICRLGLVGGLTDAGALLPVDLLGLVCTITALVIFGTFGRSAVSHDGSVP